MNELLILTMPLLVNSLPPGKPVSTPELPGPLPIEYNRRISSLDGNEVC
jgi:hypothetical protein